jgi:hypothetical protein
MTIALISLDDYVLDKKFIKINQEDFHEVELRFVDDDVELKESEILYMDAKEFNIKFDWHTSDRNYGMVYENNTNHKAFRVKVSKELKKALFDTELYIEDKIRKINRNLSENKYTQAKSVSIIFNSHEFKKFEDKADEEKKRLKREFLYDLFKDSGLEDNKHNQLIGEKAWIVTCNTDYYGDYMSTSFYSKVESWYRELKELAI